MIDNQAFLDSTIWQICKGCSLAWDNSAWCIFFLAILDWLWTLNSKVFFLSHAVVWWSCLSKTYIARPALQAGLLTSAKYQWTLNCPTGQNQPKPWIWFQKESPTLDLIRKTLLNSEYVTTKGISLMILVKGK